MEDNRFQKIALYEEVPAGHREREAPKKRYKDCLKMSLTGCNVDPLWWSDMAADRDAGRHSIFKTADEFEEDRKYM